MTARQSGDLGAAAQGARLDSPELVRVMALADGAVDLAAIEKLQWLVKRASINLMEAERVLAAVPTVAVNASWFTASRGQLGMAWHELELAQAALARRGL